MEADNVTASLMRSWRNMFLTEKDCDNVTDEDLQRFIEEQRLAFIQPRDWIKSFPAEGAAVKTVTPEFQSSQKDCHDTILQTRVDTIDAEMELAMSIIERLGQMDMITRREAVLQVRTNLEQLVIHMQSPEIISEIDAGVIEERKERAKELFSRLIIYELQLMRDGVKIELTGLKKELASLEEEQRKVDEMPVDKDKISELVRLTVEQADQQQPAAPGPTTPSAKEGGGLSVAANAIGRTPSISMSISHEQRQLLTSLQGKQETAEFVAYSDQMMAFSRDTGIDLVFIPEDNYIVGMPPPPKIDLRAEAAMMMASSSRNKPPVLMATENELRTRRHVSQLNYLATVPSGTPQRALNDFGLLHPETEHGTFPVVSHTPHGTLHLRGFYISTSPIRMSDWNRLISIPKYAQLKDVLAPAQLNQYKFTYTPTFVAGQQFTFNKVAKDLLNDADIDDPVLELTYWQAVEVANVLGARLPTWQEWEAATRGYSGQLYPWGETTDQDALTFDDPVQWEITLHPVVHDGKKVRGQSKRVTRFGSYDSKRSPHELQRLMRFGFEWNSANFDIAPQPHPQGPATHVLRTLTDYYTQLIIEGGDFSGNHRSYSGPVLPLFAMPNKYTRCAAFRLVFVPPDDNPSDIVPAELGSTNRNQESTLKKVSQTKAATPELQEIQSSLVMRISGAGGGVLRGSPSAIGFAVGAPLTAEQLAMHNLIAYFGMGMDTVMSDLGEPEFIQPAPFDSGSQWFYFSLGVLIVFDESFKRPRVSEVHLHSRTTDDLTAKEWNGYIGQMDSQGFTMKGLTVSNLEKRWGPPHNQWSTVHYYLRDFVDFMPAQGSAAGIRLANARRKNASASLAFEFSRREDGSIAKVRIKMG